MTAPSTTGRRTDGVAALGLEAGQFSTPHVEVTEQDAREWLRQWWGIDAVRLRRLATEKDDTFGVTTADGAGLVAKFANPHEHADDVDFETGLLQHVGQGGLVPVPRLIPDRDGRVLVPIPDPTGRPRWSRVMTMMPGVTMDTTYSTAGERELLGETLALMRRATSSFAHPRADREYAWDVRRLPGVAPLLTAVEDADQRALLERGLERFDAVVVPRLPTLRTAVLHNDFSKSNILVDHGTPRFVTGIIDFGDSVRTAVAVDISTALLNQLPRSIDTSAERDLFASGRAVIAGYLRHADLTDDERLVIPHLVMGRIVLRALITIRRAQLFPANSDYILRNTRPGWTQLDWFLRREADQISALLLR